MMWTLALILSVIILIGSVIFAVARERAKYKSGRVFSPSRILFLGVILSSIVLFIPMYSEVLKNSDCGIIETVMISIHSMIRLFIVDGEFSFITSNVSDLPEYIHKGYTIIFSILFVLAPILTFGFVLSFFKNFSAYKRFVTHYNKDAYIFSQLNDRSLALADSILANDSSRVIIFTEVSEKDKEQGYELSEKAKELGAICFKQDILTVNFSFHSSKSALYFFTIGENQTENVTQALKIVERFKNRENTNLYVFSTQVEAETLLAKAFREEETLKIKIRRVNEVRSLIQRNLYENGFEKIFESAYQDESGIRQINAVVIGMGQHGTEMTKALTWFCQMDGYDITINSFDKDKKAADKFKSLCPELIEKSGNKDDPEDARYTVTVHSDMDVDTYTFDSMIASLPRTTYVFVALGNDEKNIVTAVKLRSIFKRLGYDPVIQAVVYNSDKMEALKDIRNYRNEQYNIDFIGDMKTSYSEKVIIDSEVEALALERHMKWGKEYEFWAYDYNYKSSMASAVHHRMKVLCGIPGSDKKPDDRSETERRALRVLEHNRWNAYMRSEGYVNAGTTEKSGRNDIAKMHNCLVPFGQLPPKEQEKDDD